jgi:hypothetical protein
VIPLEDVSRVLMEAEADLRQAQADYEEAHSRLAAAQANDDAALERLKEMQTVRDWLEQRDQARRGVQTRMDLAKTENRAIFEKPGEIVTRFGKPIPEVANTDLCLKVLESFGKPATTKQIRDRLARDGHELSQAQVRGSLKYLSRKKPPPVTTTSGSGLWKLRRPSLSSGHMVDPVAMLSTSTVNGHGEEP